MSPKPDIRDAMNKPIKPPQDDVAAPRARHKTTQVMVGNVAVGGGAPSVGQSLTHTAPAQAAGTARQSPGARSARSDRVRATGAHHPPAAHGRPIPGSL